MEPERTTTIGDGESVMTERPFHIWEFQVNACFHGKRKAVNCQDACSP